MAASTISADDFEAAMEPLFTDRQFTESDFDRMSDLLLQFGKKQWSYRPRTYAVLRTINQVTLMNYFVSEGLTDFAFPYTAERLPDPLKDHSIRFLFLKNQELVCAEARGLEISNGRHFSFSTSDTLHFKILSFLGEGGFGDVYRVRSKLSGKEYARKRMSRKRTFASDRDAIKTFENELSNLKRLSHHHLIQVVGSYTDTKYICLLISPVADCDLKQFLYRPSLAQADLDMLRSYYGCLAAAVLYLHESKCHHNDLKPSNILIKDQTVLITDFGIARDWSDKTKSTTIGLQAQFSLPYAAPEVINYGPRSSSTDVWSLGCVFLDMATRLGGESLDDKTTFFNSFDKHPATPAGNPQALQSWLNRPRSKDSDVQPFQWIRKMLRINPRFSSTDQNSDEKSEVRLSAAEVLHEIRHCQNSYQYCGFCCNLEYGHDNDFESGRSMIEEDSTADIRELEIDEIPTIQKRPPRLNPIQNLAEVKGISNGDRKTRNTPQKSTTADTRPSHETMYLHHAKDRKQAPSEAFDLSGLNDGEVKDAMSALDKLGFDLDANGFDRDEALLDACASGHDNLVILLLKNGAKIEATALHIAARNGSEAVVGLLLAKGIEIEAKDDSGHTALHVAASNGSEAVVRLLLEKGAKIEATKQWRETALHEAASKGSEAVVRLLLEKGAKIEATDCWRETALQKAASKGSEAVVRLLLEKGAKIEATDYWRQTALHVAASKGREAVVRLLLEKGAEIEVTDESKSTALHRAASNGSEAVVRLLLGKGAKIEATDAPRWTALHVAAFNGSEAVVRLLLEKGAKIEATDDSGQTALHVAAFHGSEAVARLLLEKGANVTVRDMAGKRASSIAKESRHKELANMLKPASEPRKW